MPIPIGWRRGSRGEKMLDSTVLLALRQFPRLAEGGVHTAYVVCV